MRHTIRPATAILLTLAATACSLRPSAQPVAMPTPDGWTIRANYYPAPQDRAVLLVHGGRYTKESWEPYTSVLGSAGFAVMALDLRGYGASKEGPAATADDTHLDVLTAVRYLHAQGAASVSIVGASMGGDAAERALREASPGEIDRVVFLAHGAYGPGEGLPGRKLFLVARDDANAAGPRLPRIQRQFDAAPAPKQLVIVDGAAHAQQLFEGEQRLRVSGEIMQFLTAP
jgi:alpha-beta hydrolase superfamily lysophospholipase